MVNNKKLSQVYLFRSKKFLSVAKYPANQLTEAQTNKVKSVLKKMKSDCKIGGASLHKIGTELTIWILFIAMTVTPVGWYYLGWIFGLSAIALAVLSLILFTVIKCKALDPLDRTRDLYFSNEESYLNDLLEDSVHMTVEFPNKHWNIKPLIVQISKIFDVEELAENNLEINNLEQVKINEKKSDSSVMDSEGNENEIDEEGEDDSSVESEGGNTNRLKCI